MISDVRWFTKEEGKPRDSRHILRITDAAYTVLKVLEHPLGTPSSGRELKHLTEQEIADFGKPPFKVPAASQAIAGNLISEWAYGRVKGLAPDEREMSKI